MTFYSLTFFVFFTCLICILWLLQIPQVKIRIDLNRSRKLNQEILLISSYIFLGLADWLCCLLVLFLTLATYYCAVMIEKNIYTKLCLLIGIGFPILILGVFKYFNFFMNSFCLMLNINNPGVFNLILPLGLSFFTFSSISYIIDVYRKKYSASKEFVKLALYIAFFPKLIAGPIIRASDFLPQLNEDRSINFKNFEIGIQIFSFGLFKKIVLADHLAVFVDNVFDSPLAFDSATVILAVISYSLQIYLDFSGYSDMAIGIAKILGYDFCKNFNLPYLSRNTTEFWKRWHISLSSWLQEYLYFSLGGNRKGKLRTYINLIATMLIGGLWHGANWTFIIWGGIHGIGLCVHKIFMDWNKGKASKPTRIGTVMSIFSTFFFVSICWIFFRAENIQTAILIISRMFIWKVGINQMYSWSFLAIALTLIAYILAWSKSMKNPILDKKTGLTSIDGYYPLLDLTKFKSLVIFITILGMTICLAYTGGNPFIYGKF